MSEVVGWACVGLGMMFRMLIRAPYTHQKPRFSVLRCAVVYARMTMLVYFFNPDLMKNCAFGWGFAFPSYFLFPLHSLLSGMDGETQKSFWYLIVIDAGIVSLFIGGRYIYRGVIKLKIAFYLMELVLPDIFLFVIYNFIEIAPVEHFSQSLGFFITMSLMISLCIGGPIIMLYDLDPYKRATLLFTGLKESKKSWYVLFRHYIVKLEELAIILTHYFNAVWLHSHPHSVTST
jgi:hypothetical protein